MRSPQVLSVIVIISSVVWPMRRVCTCFSIKQIHKVHRLKLFNLFHFRGIEEWKKSYLGFRLWHWERNFVLESISLAWRRNSHLLRLLNTHVWNDSRNFLFYFERVSNFFFNWFVKRLRLFNSGRIKDLKRVWNDLFYFLGVFLLLSKIFKFKEWTSLSTLLRNDWFFTWFKRGFLLANWLFNFFKTFLEFTNYFICFSTHSIANWWTLYWNRFWRRLSF